MDIHSKKILITGANGMVGSYFDFGIKTDHRTCDVTDGKEIQNVFEKYRPDVVIHLAAETDVDRCERDSEHAYFVNAVGTFNVALAARNYGVKMIYVSTVYVFDGSKKDPYVETDAPKPMNIYGKSKYLGESAVKGMLEDYCIIRAGWMFGGGPSRDLKFIAKIIKQLQNPEIKAVNDKFGSLTFAKDLAVKIEECIEKDFRGIIHVANSGFCSRYDIAKEVAGELGANTKVLSVDSSHFPLDASRSASDRVGSLYGGILRPWQDALGEYLLTEWKSAA